MKVLVVGAGGREHALVWRLLRSPSVRDVRCAPGNAGIAELAEPVAIAADDLPALVSHAVAERYDLVVVGPEAPLVAGLADRLSERGLRVFGCSQAAAAIEASKAFAKEVMERAGVPTARFGSFSDEKAAVAWADDLVGLAGRGDRAGPEGWVVVKADGLAAGKGVVICQGAAAAREAIGRLLADGGRVVVEEFLVGREASCMALCDGERVWPLAACEDHKTVGEGDRGPMTGGMGAISPTPVIDAALLERVRREVLVPTARTLAEMDRPFRGLLYAGVMITADGPRVLEFNCRLGDPETQPLLARLDGDLGAALLAVAEGRTPEIGFLPSVAVCVVLAARGYPDRPERGAEIRGLDEAEAESGVTVFHSGTRRVGDRIVAAGGRVLGVTGVGADLAEARLKAYRGVEKIHFEGMHFRRDIGARGRTS
ncbi:MAG: phosphoribosylamine--glycine ligase [Myxococcales bacterium]|nr:phosphoribosylamine--glycine ligase [Myxococcales bacterium]